MRRHHLSVVLEHLVHNGARSRAAIAQETGLTKATVSALVADLRERALVEELEAPGGRMGRPALDVAATTTSVGALGLEIEVDYVAAAIVDLSGEVRIRHQRQGSNRDAIPGRVARRLRSVGMKALRDAEAAGIRCVGAGLALPGLVDRRSGALLVAPNLHWLDVDGASATDLGLPASTTLTIDNEANLGGLAELRYGAGSHCSSFVYVSGGTGIGAALVLDGRVIRGAHGFAGELGHVVVDPAGRSCACGARGCLETIAGAGSRASTDEVADALVAALRTVVHLVDPDALVLGGTFAKRAEFAHEIETRLRESTLGARWQPVEVRTSRFGENAALVGAASEALHAVLADPTAVSRHHPDTQTA